MKKRAKKGGERKEATGTVGATTVQTASDSDATPGTSSSGEGAIPALVKPAPEGDGPCFNTRSRTKGIVKKSNDQKKEKWGKKEVEEKKKEKVAPTKEAKSGRRAVKRKTKNGTSTPPKKPGAAKKRPDTPRPSLRTCAFPRGMSGVGEPGRK